MALDLETGSGKMGGWMICQNNRFAPKAVAELQKEAKSLVVLLLHGGKQCFSFQSLIVMLTFSWWQSHTGVPHPLMILHRSGCSVLAGNLLLVGLSGQWLGPGEARPLLPTFSQQFSQSLVQVYLSIWGVLPSPLRLQEQEHHKLISSPLWPILNIACCYKYFTMPQGEEMDISYFMAGELVLVSKIKICVWCGCPLSSLRAFLKIKIATLHSSLYF